MITALVPMGIFVLASFGCSLLSLFFQHQVRKVLGTAKGDVYVNASFLALAFAVLFFICAYGAWLRAISTVGAGGQ